MSNDIDPYKARPVAEALIDKADTYTFKGSELTLEWAFRDKDRGHVFPCPELYAADVVHGKPSRYELVARQVTAWELAE